MEGFILRFNDSIVGITNNLDKWLIDNNKQREKGDEEDLDTFQIEEVDLEIYLEED